MTFWQQGQINMFRIKQMSTFNIEKKNFGKFTKGLIEDVKFDLKNDIII